MSAFQARFSAFISLDVGRNLVEGGTVQHDPVTRRHVLFFEIAVARPGFGRHKQDVPQRPGNEAAIVAVIAITCRVQAGNIAFYDFAADHSAAHRGHTCGHSLPQPARGTRRNKACTSFGWAWACSIEPRSKAQRHLVPSRERPSIRSGIDGQTCGYEDPDAPAQLIRSTHISLPASDCCSFRRAEHAQGEPAHRQDCGRTGRNRSAQMPTPSNSPRLKLSHEL